MSIDNIIFADVLKDNENIAKELAIKLSMCTEEQRRITITILNSLIDEFQTINNASKDEDL